MTDKPNLYNADKAFLDEDPSLEDEATQKIEETKSVNEVNYKKRYDDLKRHYDKKLNEFKKKEKASEVKYEPPKTLEDLDRFKEDYPDVYGVVETVAHMQTEKQTQDIQNRFKVIEEKEKAMAQKEAGKTLLDLHPDLDEIKSSTNFHTWAKEQPIEIQDWIYKNPDNVTLASKAINLYKTEVGMSVNKTNTDMRGDAADMISIQNRVQVSEPNGRIWSRSEIANLTSSEFEQYENDIDQAIREGRIAA